MILGLPRDQTKRVPDVHWALVVTEQVEFCPVTWRAIGIIVPFPEHSHVLEHAPKTADYQRVTRLAIGGSKPRWRERCGVDVCFVPGCDFGYQSAG